MLNKISKCFLICIFFSYSNYIVADSVTKSEVSSAQGEMSQRIYDKAREYLKNIKLSDSYLYYCTQELYLKTREHPANGYVPFGVNYNTIKDSKNLDYVISNREDYETAFIVLCLANVKNTLLKAEQ